MAVILSFGAHPDDCELGCGGTELLAIARGDSVHHAFITSGDAGGRLVKPANLAKIREEEAKRAADFMGVRAVHFLRLPDGFTQFSLSDKVRVINLIRNVRPDIIFIHADADEHPDHKNSRALVLSAINGAAGPWYPESVGEPWNVAHVYGYEVWHPIGCPQMVVDISEVVTKKIKALEFHSSQMQTIPYEKAAMGLAQYRGVMTQTGAFAEAFEVIKTQWPK